jgi:hypothetical protein
LFVLAIILYWIVKEARKRAADSDDELDKGRTKKVKKYREESRHRDHNPFQVTPLC